MNTSLSETLQLLVSEDPDERRAAVTKIQYDLDLGEVVRAAVNAPGFPLVSWMNRLVDLLFWSHEERMALHYKERDRQKRIETKILERVKDDPEAHPGRMRRYFFGACDPNNKSDQKQEILLDQSVVAMRVFGALQDELLLIPDRLNEMLASKNYKMQAQDALARLGAKAAPLFAGTLIENTLSGAGHSTAQAKAVAVMIKGNVASIRYVAMQLDSQEVSRQKNALYILRLAGTDVAMIAPDAVPRMLEMLRDRNVRCASAFALGSVTQGTDVAVDALLELSESDDEWAKGAALSALGTIARQPEKVVPRLIRAFDDYEEPDPDLNYGSDHTIVTDGLAAFGQQSAPAVPALIARIEQKNESMINENGTITRYRETDNGVVRALEAIGAPAVAALPALEARWQITVEPGDDPTGFVDSSPLASAIVTLRRFAA